MSTNIIKNFILFLGNVFNRRNKKYYPSKSERIDLVSAIIQDQIITPEMANNLFDMLKRFEEKYNVTSYDFYTHYNEMPRLNDFKRWYTACKIISPIHGAYYPYRLPVNFKG